MHEPAYTSPAIEWHWQQGGVLQARVVCTVTDGTCQPDSQRLQGLPESVWDGVVVVPYGRGVGSGTPPHSLLVSSWVSSWVLSKLRRT